MIERWLRQAGTYPLDYPALVVSAALILYAAATFLGGMQ